MIEVQLPRGVALSTILAPVPIPEIDVLSCEPHFLLRELIEIKKEYHSWDLQFVFRRGDVFIVRLNKDITPVMEIIC